MELKIQNSLELLNPDTFKFKCLVYSLPGGGKTEWATDAINPGVIACETGHGHGLLTAARKGIDYVVPTCMADLYSIIDGKIFADKDSIIVDSLSEISKTFIKDDALSVNRKKGDTDKRKRGVPELDDYGTMGILTQRFLRGILSLDKHIVVTATMRFEKPDAETGRGAFIVGPDLPGQMFLGSTAMFDTVLCLKAVTKMRDAKDAKSKYTERFFITEPDGTHIAKSRSEVEPTKPILDRNEIFDIKEGTGTWPDMYGRILDKYSEIYNAKKGDSK